jgi:hypothetical protein
MFLKTRLLALGVITAALGGAPVASASAQTSPPGDPVVTGPSCPPGYDGPTNLATGCPYWMMSYSVQYPGQPPVLRPVGWTPPLAARVAMP